MYEAIRIGIFSLFTGANKVLCTLRLLTTPCESLYMYVEDAQIA